MIDKNLDDKESIEFLILDSLSTQSSPQKSNVQEVESQELIQDKELPHNRIDIRSRYLSKLQQNGLLFDKPRKKCHHITIFDWDDTLFCTTYLSRYEIVYMSQVNQKVSQKIEEIDTKTSNILEIAAQLSIVYIITNAVQGWVQHCLKNFMPKTKKIIKQFQIIIISARGRYEQKFPNDIQRWKRQTFKDILQPINKNLVTLNLTCIGDSMAEIKAVEQLNQLFSKQILKTIKFYEKPRMDELYKQLSLLRENIRKVIISTKNMQIKMHKK